MKRICDHAGWGMYAGEEGPCPPPAEMVEIPGGWECPTCGHSFRAFSGPDAVERAMAPRQTAVIRNIERR